MPDIFRVIPNGGVDDMNRAGVMIERVGGERHNIFRLSSFHRFRLQVFKAGVFHHLDCYLAAGELLGLESVTVPLIAARQHSDD